jgi:hypothetical protein
VTPLSDFQKQFNFKPESNWTYTNTSTGDIDTIVVSTNDGVVTEYSGAEGHLNPCQTAWESFTVSYTHNLLVKGSTKIQIVTSGDRFLMVDRQASSIALLRSQAGDSIVSGQMHVKLEQILPTYQIQDLNFKNVSVMRYAPSAAGFNRIWWCPGEGFVEFEILNEKTAKYEHWQLIHRLYELY